MMINMRCFEKMITTFRILTETEYPLNVSYMHFKYAKRVNKICIKVNFSANPNLNYSD